MIWRLLGGALTLCGVALIGVIAWQVWAPNVAAAQAQQSAEDTLLRRDNEPVGVVGVAPGAPIAQLSIPRLGATWVIVEGVGDAELAVGPGHYPGTAQPGQVGNFAVAGHRVGHGAPFFRLNELQACDDVVVTAHGQVSHYRVLPPVGVAAPCGVAGIDVPGQHIVGPDRGDLVLPVPGQPEAVPTRSLLTMTTCHPRYSAAQRLVVHATLVDVTAQ